MTSPQASEGKGPRAVITNGEGNRTTAHLNLTRSLADMSSVRPPRNIFDTKTRQRAARTKNSVKIAYAGAER